MNIFNFISVVMTATSKFTVECCETLTTSASAANKCAQMADTTADAMLREIEADNEQKLKEILAKHAATELPEPVKT